MQPKVQILLATFNGERYLPDQLESLRRQVGAAWQLTVSDDGSTDGTVQLLEAFRDQHCEDLLLLEGPRAGTASANFFHLLRHAPVSDFYALCDQDDVWLPNKLRTLLDRCIASEDGDGPVLTFSDLFVVDQGLERIASSFMDEIAAVPDNLSFGSCLVENAIPGCTMIFNHALRELFLEYNGDLSDARMHDWWLALIAFAAGSVSYVAEPLSLYRQHSDNAAGSVRRRGIRFALAKLRASGATEVAANARQAALLLRAHGSRLPAVPRAQAEAVAAFPTMTKYQRISACLRLGILKQGTSRRTYQLVKI